MVCRDRIDEQTLWFANRLFLKADSKDSYLVEYRNKPAQAS
jgi:hypothetical protein